MVHSPTLLRVVVLAAVLCAGAPGALALRANLESPEFTGHVMAPDWVWQGRDITVMVRLRPKAEEGAPPPSAGAPVMAEAGSDGSRAVRVRLELGEKAQEYFGRNGAPHTWTEEELSAEVNPYGVFGGQYAFSGITVLDEAPVGEYTLRVQVGEVEPFMVPIRVIPGQVIRGGPFMAVAVPAGIALVWCVAFALVVSRLGPPGAWRTPSRAVAEAAPEQPWMEETRGR